MREHPLGEQAGQTRDRILTAAARLFSEHGYEHVPLSHVARESQVSKALVLWHFDSKEKLFQAALGRTLEPYFIDLDDLAALDDAERIERLIDHFYEFVRDNVYSVRFLLGLIVRPERKPNDPLARVGQLYDVFRSMLADAIESGRRSGRFRQELHPRLDASLILAALGGILIERLLHDEPHADELLAYLKRTAFQRLIG
jgi:AcrR family transcriptional regulator